MGWSLATVWWVVTGVLVAVELATGSFYLLMLALGAAAAAIAAHLGLGLNAQLVIGALLGAGAVAAWHLKRRREPASATIGTRKEAAARSTAVRVGRCALSAMARRKTAAL
jgi:membrane protein implicated in regulation of membrane protease activity